MMKNLFLLAVGLLSSLTLSAQPEGWNDPATTLTKTTSIIADRSTVYYLKNEGVAGWFIQGNNWWTQACVASANEAMPETSPYGFQIRFSDTATHEGFYQIEDMSPDGKFVQNSWKYLFDNAGTIYTDYGSQGIDKTYWQFTFDDNKNATLVTYMNPNSKVGLVSEDGETPKFYEDDGATSRGGGSTTGAYTMNNTGTVVCTTWSLWCMGDPNAVAEYNAATALVARMQEIFEESEGEFSVDSYYEQIGNQLGTIENAERLIALEKQMNADYQAWKLKNASGDNPVDIALTNPGFETGNMDGWTKIDGTTLYAAQGNKSFDNVQGNYYAEFWHKNGNYSAQQTLEDMPAGVYKLSAYAYSSNEMAVLFMNEAESDTIGVSKKYSVGMYLPETGSITLGIKSSDTGNAWNCVDDFKLVFLGNDGTSWAALFDDTYKDEASFCYQQGLQDKIDVLRAATTQEAIQRAYSDARDYEANVVAENVAAWKDYKSLIEEAKTLANKPEYAEEAVQLSAMVQQAWTLDNAETDPTTEQLMNDEIAGFNVIKAEYDRVKSNTPAGTDVTEAFIKNYDFTQQIVGLNSGDPTKGWRIDGDTGGARTINTGAKCGECWSGKNFDFYQIIENAPVGVYQVEAQGFTRAGRGNQSWGFYHDQNTGALLDKPVFGDWTPNEAHIYLNDNTGDLSISYAYPHAVEEGFFDSGYYQDPLGQYQYPDDMHSAGLSFAAGEYKVTAFGLVAKAGDQMRIGMKGDNFGFDNWAIFTNFRLIYQAFQADIIEPEFNKAVASLGEAHVGTELQTEMADLLARAEAVSHSDGKAMFTILSDIYAFNVKKASSEAVFAQLLSENQNLEAVYAEYKNKCTQQARQAAQALQVKATEAYEDEETHLPTVTTEEAGQIIEEFPAVLTALKTPASAGSDDDPVDFTSLITNANMAAAKGWTDKESNMTVNSEYKIAEFFNKENYNVYQELTGMPEGLYAVQVQGFYRAGEIAEDWPAVAAGQQSNAYFYVINDNKTLAEEGVEPDTINCPFRHVSAEAINENPGFGGETTITPFAELGDETPWYMPNNLSCASQFFAAEDAESQNFYTNLVYVYVWGPTDKVTIGVKKEGPAVKNDWCAFSNWKLTGYGNESVKEPGAQTFSCTPVTPTPTITYVRGDANGDGEVGMPDVMFVVNYILGTPAETFNFDNADANLDGEIGMPDVMYIVNYILNGKFPDEEDPVGE